MSGESDPNESYPVAQDDSPTAEDDVSYPEPQMEEIGKDYDPPGVERRDE